MKHFSHDELLQAEQAIHSARRKNEKVWQTLKKKASPHPGLIMRTERQLEHLQVMHDLIKEALGYPSPDDIVSDPSATLKYIEKTLLQLHNLRPKIKEGSAQETLILKRIAAFALVRDLIDNREK